MPLAIDGNTYLSNEVVSSFFAKISDHVGGVLRRGLLRGLGALTVAALALSSHALPSQLDPPVTQVVANGNHSCALTTVGGVKCWGKNQYGELGDNSTTDRAAPVGVSGLASGIVAVAAGAFQTCSLATNGGVKCWGYNLFGQLGNGNSGAAADSLTPVDVASLTSGVAAIVAGYYHACALTMTGGVKCWGLNGNGQLGDGTFTDHSTATDVSGLTGGVVAIAAGSYYTCALTTSRGMKCWGKNDYGQLGDGSTTTRSTPVDVSGLASGVASIAAGRSHSCALTTSGGVLCWGDNFAGQLGDNTTFAHTTPASVSALASGVTVIATGSNHSCAVSASGGLKCWGFNGGGQLGDNSTTNRLAPVDVIGLTGSTDTMAAIAAGDSHTCAMTIGGGVKCWGDNSNGQVGDSSNTQRRSAVDVTGLVSGLATISGGSFHTCALTTGGGLTCWGANESGQLGDNTTTQRRAPVDVNGLASGVASLSSGGAHTCALTADSGAKCWGYNLYGQVGDGSTTQRKTPADVSGLVSGVVTISAGLTHTCALLTPSGGMKCWGNNSDGQLGDNTKTNRASPVDVSGLTSGVVAIAAGGFHTCALTSGGGVKCWGRNINGQLGNGSSANVGAPVDVIGLTSGVAAIASGGAHSCALTTGGGVKCWGDNYSGQLGNGSSSGNVPVSVAVDVSGLDSGVALIAAGEAHTCAVNTSGGVKCWGSNLHGPLGDNSDTDRYSPVDVSGLAIGVLAVTTGGQHTCAITVGRTLKCWGLDASGQLGDKGSVANRLTPVNILFGQAVAFVPPTALSAGGSPVPLNAAASGSGLAVRFDTWTPAICTVSGTTVSATAIGLCGIRASQAGDGNNAAAPQKLVLVNVVTPTLNLDASNALTRYLAATDGAMIVRYMQGVRNGSLTLGLTATDAAHTNPTAIAEYLDSMRSLLDVDGNGAVDPGADGLLIVRYMLGFRGAALIADALGAAPRARSAAADIEAWLAALMP